MTHKDAEQWFFWLAIGGVLSSFFIGPIMLVLCIPAVAFMFVGPFEGSREIY